MVAAVSTPKAPQTDPDLQRGKEEKYPPKLGGPVLSTIVWLADKPIVGPPIVDSIKKQGRFFLPPQGNTTPTANPAWQNRGPRAEVRASSFIPEAVKVLPKAPPRHSGGPLGTRDYVEAFRTGATTPSQVAEAFLAAHAQCTHLNIFVAMDPELVRAQAKAATERWAQRRPLSVFDGVPCAIKDEFDMLPFKTRGGTSCIAITPEQDAFIVGRFRASGAVLVGKTNMYQVGAQPTGANPHFGQVLNPHDLTRDTGGSSSGSAAAVAAGLCPVSVGADGGGSGRIPAGLCDVVGLKPTFGVMSDAGAMPLCWSVAHPSVFGASTEDAALALTLSAGADARDENTLVQPPLNLGDWQNTDLSGLRLGVYPAWLERADPQVVQVCNDAIARLRKRGAIVREIVIPQIDLMRRAHTITILSEMAANMETHPGARKGLGHGARLAMTVGRSFSSGDYVRAQQVRTQMRQIWEETLTQVDLVVTPTTAITAPKLPSSDPHYGSSNVEVAVKLMEYIIAGNFVGVPGISTPAGYDNANLPVGIHFAGRAYEEGVLLRASYTLEQHTKRHRPTTHFNLLGT